MLRCLLAYDFHHFQQTRLIAEADALALYLCQMDGRDIFALLVEFEVQVVGEDDGVERGLVAVELLFVLAPPVEVAVLEVFGFYKRQGQVVAQQREVGCAAVDAALLVDDGTLAQLLEQFLQRWAERVFGSQPREVLPVYCFM